MNEIEEHPIEDVETVFNWYVEYYNNYGAFVEWIEDNYMKYPKKSVTK